MSAVAFAGLTRSFAATPPFTLATDARLRTPPSRAPTLGSLAGWGMSLEQRVVTSPPDSERGKSVGQGATVARGVGGERKARRGGEAASEQSERCRRHGESSERPRRTPAAGTGPSSTSRSLIPLTQLPPLEELHAPAPAPTPGSPTGRTMSLQQRTVTSPLDSERGESAWVRGGGRGRARAGSVKGAWRRRNAQPSQAPPPTRHPQAPARALTRKQPTTRVLDQPKPDPLTQIHP